MSLDTNIRRALAPLLPKIIQHHASSPDPIVLGITGLQGSGKSTWASRIVEILSTEHNLYTITISLDDVYKTHSDLIARRDLDPTNKLYLTRGQPGTHDEALAQSFFSQLKAFQGSSAGGDDDDNNNNNNETNTTTTTLHIPTFDKSLHNGAGDRAPRPTWPRIIRKPSIIIFEGWCLGFTPLSPEIIAQKHTLAVQGNLPINTPAHHTLAHLLEVNSSLQRYCDTFMGPRHFDFFVHIDTLDLRNVYAWRMQQERKMIEVKGRGMTDEQVRAFVDGYMPSYEIYLDKLREGFFKDRGRMVRVVLGREREVVKVEEL